MSMATASSLVSQIHSVLQNPDFTYFSAINLRIGLRNLKVLIACLRNLGNDDTHTMQSFFSRIEGAIGRFPSPDPSRRGLDKSQLNCSVSEVNCLAKEGSDEWNANTMPNRLSLDDVAEIADSILHNIADFYNVCGNNPVTQRGVMDEFEVQTRFLRDFLLFLKRSGVENHQVQNLLIHVRPFALDAARVFRIDGLFSAADANWVEQVKTMSPRVDLQVFQCYTQALQSMSALDQTDDDVLKDFLGSFISLLWHLLRYQRHPRHSDSLKALYESLRLSRFILKQQMRSNLGSFEDHIGVLIRDAGIVICSLYFTDADLLCLSDLLQRFDVLQAKVSSECNSLKPNTLDFGGESTAMESISDVKVQIDTVVESHQSSSTPQVIGFQKDEVTSILDRVTRGSKQLRLIPISGMAGLGKTTFALEIYNNPSVTYGFQARAWCPISQVFDKNKVLIQLLNQIQPRDYSSMSEDDLANKLRQSLKGKRYLILLDDVWTPQVWESLRPSFPDDSTQSRIVLTTRLHAIVPDEQPHFLRMRKENECLEIIEMQLLHKVGWRPWSTELRKFAKLCKGLPLTAVLVAGLLSTTMHEGWEGILDHLSSGGISRMEKCKIALELSYKHLPGDLRLCFMYFGAFPEDEEIYAKKLVRLWVAEGLVAKNNDLLKNRVEDVAQEYLDNLIQRNLVMVAKKRSMGGVKTCRIHDLLHDFCLMKGKQENLFHRLLQSHDELSDFNETCSLERLSIHSTALHFKESRLFCPRAHSMLFFDTSRSPDVRRLSDLLFIIQIYKLLKVLDMDLIRLRAEIPSEIAMLTRLTYLSVRSLEPFIPSSIGNLSNLETLIINIFSFKPVSLPHTIWDLHKLKYLHITINYSGFSLPIENSENSPGLLELETICGVSLYSDGSMEKQMRKFPNIRRLKCNIQCDGESSGELNKTIVVPEYLSKLELLSLRSKRLRHGLYFGCAESLRKVKFEDFVFSREEIAVIGKLPNLEVLKLSGIVFLGGTMEIEEGEFSKLRILILHETYDHGNLETWTVDGDEQLPCLEKLVFHKYKKLKDIPYCLEASLTLEEIVVSSCSPALETLVRHVEEVQKDFGNLIKVQYSFQP